jgi:hypothetical protein
MQQKIRNNDHKLIGMDDEIFEVNVERGNRRSTQKYSRAFNGGDGKGNSVARWPQNYSKQAIKKINLAVEN